jgi:hypothetical protein
MYLAPDRQIQQSAPCLFLRPAYDVGGGGDGFEIHATYSSALGPIDLVALFVDEEPRTSPTAPFAPQPAGRPG